jgi:hypothetical protein
MKQLRINFINNNLLILSLFLALLVSCSDPEENKPTSEELATRKKFQIIDNNLEKLSKKLEVKYNLTRLPRDWKYSIDYDKVINSKLQMIEGAIIEDIYYSGKDNIILQLKDRATITDYYLTISKDKYQKCISKYKNDGAEYFIVKLSRVKKIKESYPTKFYANGDLIDVYDTNDLLNLK